MKRVAVLGATGSIGTQTLDIIARLPEWLQAVSLIANANGDLLRELGSLHPRAELTLIDEGAASIHGLPGGMQAAIDAVTSPNVDLVVVSVAGVIGLQPTVAAIRAGKQIALASKEVLVAAGEWVMPLVQEHQVVMTPIDSEHSAIFQCLQGYRTDQVREVILTASGGPFRGWSRSQLQNVGVKEALNHPTWNMGGKITIDSATMMNKALETIEARWLFDLSIDHVRVVVHPQSVVHSLVVMKDGTAMGQLGFPDMRLPIQIALLHPEKVDSGLPPWCPIKTPALSFEELDERVFPAIQMARAASNAGGTMPCVFNAANEAAVALFLGNKIGFLDVFEIVHHVMDRHQPVNVTMESLLETDAWARLEASQWKASE